MPLALWNFRSTMDFQLSDSSGGRRKAKRACSFLDDDLPPSHQNKFRSQVLAVEKTRATVVNTAPFHQMQNMEAQIHHIEQEAYCSVLRAFKAQSDAITWEMESLITELRKELRVTDDEHRKLLSRVNADDMIQRIREWRTVNRLQPGISYKKQKTSQSGASIYLGPPPMALHQPVQPPSPALKRVSASGLRTNKLESYASTGFTDRDQVHRQGLGGASTTKELDRDNSSDPLIGRKVWTRWPEDNNFYEAVISDFNAIEGRHALVYDASTPNEAWEWVNLREISPNDIRWKQEDVGISHRGGRSGLGRGIKKSMAYGRITTDSGRGNGILKGQSKNELHPSQYGIGRMALNDLEILHTDTLVKEVDKVFSSSHADPMDIEKARKVLKDHEQALLDAIAKLEGISDGESGNIWRRYEVDEGSNGYNVAKEARDGPNRSFHGDGMR